MLRLATICLLLGVVSCTDEGPREKKGSPAPLRDESFVPFSGLRGEADLRLDTGSDPVALTWAVARCGCANGRARSLLEAVAQARGPLPQILMPAIREQVRNSEELQSLLDVPLVGGLLADIFVDDQRIATSIKEGLVAQLAATPGGTTIGERLAIRFDAFPDPTQTGNKPPTSFDFAAQVPRWALVLSHPGLFEGGDPLGGDHGLQTLELMRLLSEWQYMFGLSPDPQGGWYGGLARAAEPGAPLVGRFDPREETPVPRFFHGRYQARISPAESALELAQKGRVRWQADQAPIALKAQAPMWEVAALAFRRLAPAGRGEAAAMFAPGSLFPADTHMLALGFLPGMRSLLAGPYIESEARLIRGEAALERLGGDGKNSIGEPADALGLARLIMALSAWRAVFAQLDGADLDEELQERLTSAGAAMLDPLRLAAQALVDRHLVGASYGYAVRLGAEDKKVVTDLAVAGEVVVALLTAAEALASPLLEQAAIGSAHWLTAEWLEPAWDGEPLSEVGALWATSVFDRWGQVANQKGPDWRARARAALQRSWARR